MVSEEKHMTSNRMNNEIKGFNRVVLTFLYEIKRRLAAIKLWLGKKLGLVQSLMIMPYTGFGNTRQIYFTGRVLRDRGIGVSTIEDSKWKNFVKMYRRFMSWEIPFAEVEASWGNRRQTTVTNEEGYFEFHIEAGDETWFDGPHLELNLRLVSRVLKKQGSVEAVNQVFIPVGNAGYGIVSDIDDTIVPTGATRMWEMFKTTFFRNTHSRIPFPGVSAFYKALSHGAWGHQNNPVFYVSSSPWNLYDFLMEFMEVHGIPKGPLMLRDV